jgi:hypothetical protein
MNARTLRALAAHSLLAAVVTGAPAEANAQPAAREILNRYAEAIGGAELWKAREGWHTTGEFSLTAMGLTGSLEIWGGTPDRTVTRVTIPAIGDILRGYDGTVGWSINPVEGPRLLAGPELKQLADEAHFGAVIRDPAVITSAETLEKGTVDGQECWRVKLVWKSGRETVDCYGIETGLLIGSSGTATTAMGSAEYSTVLGDYKSFGPYRIPTRITQTALGQQQVITTTTFDVGPVDASKFALPEPIRALVKGGG